MIKCVKCGDWFVILSEYENHIEKKHIIKKIKKEKILDPMALYEKMLKFYMDKKHYSKDQANDIAQKIVNQQLEKHGKKPVF